EVAARERYAIAVRAGGHSVAGMSSNDDGIVIDVRPMKNIEIDAAAMTARVGAGVTWSEFDRAGTAHGLATTGGRVSTTDVAGFSVGRAYRELAFTAPDELGSGLVFITPPPEPFVPTHLQGTTVAAIAVLWAGEIADGEAAIRPLRDLGPEVDLVGPMLYAD